jgi:hypothetical protein
MVYSVIWKIPVNKNAALHSPKTIQRAQAALHKSNVNRQIRSMPGKSVNAPAARQPKLGGKRLDALPVTALLNLQGLIGQSAGTQVSHRHYESAIVSRQ